MNNNRMPVLVVTSERWSRDPYIVFENDPVTIPADWIHDAYLDALEHDETVTYDEIATELKNDFIIDNSNVDKSWPEHSILLSSDGNYYRYNENGQCEYITGYDAKEQLK